MTVANSSVLLVTAVAIRKVNGQYFIDDQTYEGLDRWCQEFKTVTYIGLESTSQHSEGHSTVTWRSMEPLIASGNLTIGAMPIGYRISSHFRHYRSVRTRLGEMIARHEYLCFSIGALFGDWGAVAALEADTQGRRFAVWFDRVEHQVSKATLPSMRFKRRLKTIAMLPFMKLYHTYMIRRAAVGIFQGRDCFDFYRHQSRNPQLVYDTHTKSHHFISEADIEAKIARARVKEPLLIVYAGRAAPMKGPEDWIALAVALKKRGVAFSATWLGDGPSLNAMKAAAKHAGVASDVRFAGHISDREYLLKTLRESDLFLFCHKTAESPRCLIEALVCGTPLIGYASAYAAGLLDGEDAGRLVDIGDTAGLADAIVDLDRSRNSLEILIRQAAALGRRFDEATLYRERAALLRRSL